MIRVLPFDEAISTWDLPDPDRNLFSSPGWMRVLRRTYGLDLFVMVRLDAGRIRSHIVYSVVRNFLEWKVCVCSYCDYCDGRVEGPEDWRAFFAELRRTYPSYRIAVRNLRDPHARVVPEFRVLSHEVHHDLDVTGSEREVWRRAHASFRAAVTQARRKGVTVRPCRRDELEGFYGMHLRVRKVKYRLFAQPFRFFEEIWREFVETGRGVLLGAYDPRGRLVGANFYLVCGRTLYYKFNTSAIEALDLRPNNIMFWEGVLWARSRGIETIDLGSSGPHQRGLILFKDHTGARRGRITHLGYHPPDYVFSRKRILKLWTRLGTHPRVPDRWTAWAGERIYPYLA